MKRSNLIGQTFDKLTVVDVVIEKGRSNFLCICECGNTSFVKSHKLKSGATKSCGCIRKMTYKARGLKVKTPSGLSNARKVINYYKRNAKRRNIEFCLTEEECITLFKQNCHYCNSPAGTILMSNGYNGAFIYNGIDRKDNNIHYILTNCVPCCKYCNFMKNNLTVGVFYEQVEKIYHTLKSN